MDEPKKRLFLIKMPYWLGIGADALWTIGLFSPPVFGVLIGNPEFSPDLQVRLIMGIGGSLMMGWTLLLLWAVRKPVERRIVILLTAFPVVLGVFIITLIPILSGVSSNIWILIKALILMISMLLSYLLACKMDNGKD